MAVICRDALAGRDSLGPVADSLEAELFANAWINAADTGQARARAQSRLADPGTSSAWHVYDALSPPPPPSPPATPWPAWLPCLPPACAISPPDSLTAVYALLVLIWNEELATAGSICDAVLSAARGRGSMSMVAHASCLRSMIMRRLGQLDDAADDGKLALDFKLATSPPLAIAWAAAFCIDALTRLGRLDQADAIAAAAADREPPPGGSTPFSSCRPGALSGSRSAAPAKHSAICSRRPKAGMHSALTTPPSHPGAPTRPPRTSRSATRKRRQRSPPSSSR